MYIVVETETQTQREIVCCETELILITRFINNLIT